MHYYKVHTAAWKVMVMRLRLSPLSVNIGIVLGNRRHSMAEHYIGIVKGLLHLHGTI